MCVSAFRGSWCMDTGSRQRRSNWCHLLGLPEGFWQCAACKGTWEAEVIWRMFSSQMDSSLPLRLFGVKLSYTHYIHYNYIHQLPLYTNLAAFLPVLFQRTLSGSIHYQTNFVWFHPLPLSTDIVRLHPLLSTDIVWFHPNHCVVNKLCPVPFAT